MTDTKPTRHAVALIAEDEALLLMEASDILTDAGFTVLEAGSADAALEHLQSHPDVSLLFTDVQMPGDMNGLELAREAKRRWPNIAIIVCSAVVRPAKDELPLGSRFINKPMDAALVQQVLDEMGLAKAA